MKRVLTGLLALCLLWGLRVSAAEREVTLRYREGRDSVELTLDGLTEDVYALQLTLALKGQLTGVTFTASGKDVYSPACRVEAGREETEVTVYLVAEGSAPLGSRSARLGTLAAKERLELPARGELLMLDENLEAIGGGSRRVSLVRDSSGSSGSGSGGGSSSSSAGRDPLYPVHIAPLEHGSITVRPTSARQGASVYLTVVPDAEYRLEDITAEDGRGRTVTLSKDGLNRYVFTMPASEVEVNAVFVRGGEMRFQDVTPGDWCYDAVRYVFEAGLMNGTTSTEFTPSAPTTRGMIVAILYRLEGSPAGGTNRFSDVSPSAYYASAVSWASDNGIVNGYSDGTFRPNNLITREQTAAFLYRYAQRKGCDVSERADLSVFADAGQIASYAVEPVRWANAMGLINGLNAETLSPRGNTTRAQAAVMLSRYVQNVV